jgi:muramidase (phage lysozyme)
MEPRSGHRLEVRLMDEDQAGILLLIVAVAAAVYFLGGSSGDDSSAGDGDSDLAGSALLGSAEDSLMSFTNDVMGDGGMNSGNRAAFLQMIGQSELGAALIGETDSGYNVLCGATPSNPLTFSDYSTHPDILNQALDSTAAGLYQINYPTWLSLVQDTGLSDFSPSTQDAMAIQLITNKGALADVDAGNFASAVSKCNKTWASFTGSPYGQHTWPLSTLQAWYQNAGGALA